MDFEASILRAAQKPCLPRYLSPWTNPPKDQDAKTIEAIRDEIRAVKNRCVADIRLLNNRLNGLHEEQDKKDLEGEVHSYTNVAATQRVFHSVANSREAGPDA